MEEHRAKIEEIREEQGKSLSIEAESHLAKIFKALGFVRSTNYLQSKI